MERLADNEVAELKGVAWKAIEHGCGEGVDRAPLEIDGFPAALREIRASFVTLRADGRLRGCMGSLEARSPLVEDVARNAHNAAFRDPRFAPVKSKEVAGLDLKISVLSPPELFPVESEEELVARLCVGEDGIILKDGPRKATFLPAVWEMISSPEEFVRQLKRKAGLSEDHWSERTEVFRYRADEY